MEKIKHIFYINLEARLDRRILVEEELRKVGFSDFERFNAIRLANGAIGCTMSHIKCLELAKTRNYPHVLIVEDDIEFRDTKLFQRQFKRFVERHFDDFDVVILSGNNMPPYETIDDCCVKVSQCQTTTGYLVKSHYYDVLLANFRESVKKLMVEPEKHALYAVDKHWFQLQRKDKWYLIVPLSVTQRSGYSDIEHRETNYTPAMLDLDKKAYFRAK